MTKAEFLSYWNERIKAIQTLNANMAIHNLDSLPAIIERRRKREERRKLLGTLFPEMTDQEWRVIRFGVIKKLVKFLYWMEWQVQQEQRVVEETAKLMKPGVDYEKLDNYPKHRVCAAYYLEAIKNL